MPGVQNFDRDLLYTGATRDNFLPNAETFGTLTDIKVRSNGLMNQTQAYLNYNRMAAGIQIPQNNTFTIGMWFPVPEPFSVFRIQGFMNSNIATGVTQSVFIGFSQQLLNSVDINETRFGIVDQGASGPQKFDLTLAVDGEAILGTQIDANLVLGVSWANFNSEALVRPVACVSCQDVRKAPSEYTAARR